MSKSKAYNRGSLLASGSSSAKPAETPQAAFKPRKVKKTTDSKYRDRASERREGVNEYAEVEGILQDFEKRMEGEKKEVVEEQRKYLGGDAAHTVLVKGLDFALLEQTRAREEARDDLDDDIESAFQGKTSDNAPSASTSTSNQGKKRTRAELLAELQRSREANSGEEQNAKPSTRQEEVEALERAKQAGKFKPMGASSFAPVDKKKKKKKKVVGEGQDKPKATNGEGETKTSSLAEGEKATTFSQSVPEKQDPADKSTANENSPQPTSTSAKVTAPETAGLDSLSISAPPQPAEEIEDVDPFADAGEYEPDYGDDSDAEGKDNAKDASSSAPLSQPAASGRRNWFNDPEPEPAPMPAKPPTPPPQSPKDVEDARPSQSMRLEGFSSSAMPSISEFLAMDKAEEEREKKRARKEKKKKAA